MVLGWGDAQVCVYYRSGGASGASGASGAGTKRLYGKDDIPIGIHRYHKTFGARYSDASDPRISMTHLWLSLGFSRKQLFAPARKDGQYLSWPARVVTLLQQHPECLPDPDDGGEAGDHYFPIDVAYVQQFEGLQSSDENGRTTLQAIMTKLTNAMTQDATGLKIGARNVVQPAGFYMGPHDVIKWWNRSKGICMVETCRRHMYFNMTKEERDDLRAERGERDDNGRRKSCPSMDTFTCQRHPGDIHLSASVVGAVCKHCNIASGESNVYGDAD